MFGRKFYAGDRVLAPLKGFEGFVVGGNAAAQAADSVITLRGDQLEVVSHFKYLGSIFTSDCTLDAEITHRVAAANSAFQKLRQANIWSSIRAQRHHTC